MEAELLRGMIADREQRIVNIKRKTEEQKEKELRLSKELEEVSAENMQAEIQLQTVKTRLLHSRQQAYQQLEVMQRDLQQQGLSLQAYAGAVMQKQQQSEGVDTSYVMRMQAQLCKAMHSLGIGDHQMELAKAHVDSLVKMQRDAVAAVREEKSQVELELMKLLQEQKEEIQRLEKENEEQLEMLQELEEQIQEIKEEKAENEPNGETQLAPDLHQAEADDDDDAEDSEEADEEEFEDADDGEFHEQNEDDSAIDAARTPGTDYEDAKDTPTPESSSNGEVEESEGDSSENAEEHTQEGDSERAADE